MARGRIPVKASKSFLLIVLLGMAPSLAFAYVGPGAGLTAIGAALALVGAILLGIVGFFWYPLKRMFGGGDDADELEDEAEEGEALARQSASDSDSQDR